MNRESPSRLGDQQPVLAGTHTHSRCDPEQLGVDPAAQRSAAEIEQVLSRLQVVLPQEVELDVALQLPQLSRTHQAVTALLPGSGEPQ